MIVAAQMRPMFWSSSRTGDEAHNAENMSKMLIQVIHEIEESCGEGSVCGVVTDNASVMKKACQALQAAKKSILYNGCAAHATNLIIGKLFDSKPISKSLAILEQGDCSASLVYETFMGMMNHHAYSSGGDLELAVLDTINRRWRAFHSRNMLAAYLLDPTKSLTNFMVGLSDGKLENLYKELERFVIEKDRWGPTELTNNAKKTPTTWWFSRDYKELSILAQRLFAIPTSSASSERSWSIHGFIHTKLRNRLHPAKFEKLGFIYSNQGNKGPVDSTFYEKRDFLDTNRTPPMQQDEPDDARE
ncbi:hypothetical protein AeNC1_015323, partial [Aphanomyces euteiches]